jgi:hypothetical protein
MLMTLVTSAAAQCFFHSNQDGFAIPNTTKMVACHEWEFNMTDSLGNTWSSEWTLVCDKKYLKIVAEMIFLVGVATGGIVSGMLSDKFGRKKMLFISAVFQSFFGRNGMHAYALPFVPAFATTVVCQLTFFLFPYFFLFLISLVSSPLYAAAPPHANVKNIIHPRRRRRREIQIGKIPRSRIILGGIVRDLFDVAGTAGHRVRFRDVFGTHSGD